jgi:hypothetical protein
VRFNKKTRKITVECWPRFADVADGDAAQFPGWPITFDYRNNDGRKIIGYLPELVVTGIDRPVVQVIEKASGEILYTVRATSNRFKPPIYNAGQHTVKVGKDKPNMSEIAGLIPVAEGASAELRIDLD